MHGTTERTDLVAALLVELRAAVQGRRIEELADRLARTGDIRAIEPLIGRLGDLPVQEDPDVEDAVCAALVDLGVMHRDGNLLFAFEPDGALSSQARAALRKHEQSVPRKYLRPFG